MRIQILIIGFKGLFIDLVSGCMTCQESWPLGKWGSTFTCPARQTSLPGWADRTLSLSLTSGADPGFSGGGFGWMSAKGEPS